MGNKGSTQTTKFSIPDWESKDWTNLIGQSQNQINQDINSVDYGGIQNQMSNTSQNILDQRMDPSKLSSGIISAGNSAWTNPGTAQSYMNPYENTALASQVNMDRSSLLDPALAQADRGAAASGALGGSRNALERSQIVNNFNNTEANTIAQGENSAYQSGQNAYATDAARHLAGEQAGAQTQLAGANSNVYADFAAGQNNANRVAISQAPGQQLTQQAGILASLPKQGTQQTTETPNGGMLGGIMSGVLGAAGTLMKGMALAEGGIVDAPAKKKRKRNRSKRSN